MKWTEHHIKLLHQEGKVRGYEITPLVSIPASDSEKKAKYGNKKMEIDGIVFDSQKEGFRYKHLKLLESAGLISGLQLQVPYELNPGGTHSVKYIADFVYQENGEEVVEDAKGFRTREYRKRCRLMKKVHDITIKET